MPLRLSHFRPLPGADASADFRMCVFFAANGLPLFRGTFQTSLINLNSLLRTLLP